MAGRRHTVKGEEIFQLLAERSDPVLSTMEVASMIPFGRHGAWSRLSDLGNRGLMTSKKISRSTAWWKTENGNSYFDREIDENTLEENDD